jgi:hypothetical protein
LRKIGFILFLVILNSGCFVFRNSENNSYKLPDAIIAERLLEKVKRQNVTAKSFNIQKAEIKISSPEGRKKVLGSLKFENPDKYLLSIKSKTGIEAARILITDDTILINDRINRKLYCGSTQYLRSKYGIGASVLPLILGDYLGGNLFESSEAKCSEGKLNIDGIVTGIKIKYVIDCKKGKTILAIPESNLSEEGIKIEYSYFLKTGEILIPGRIKIIDFQSETTIEIVIHKFEFPWIGNLEFIPGNKYEILKLK